MAPRRRRVASPRPRRATFHAIQRDPDGNINALYDPISNQPKDMRHAELTQNITIPRQKLRRLFAAVFLPNGYPNSVRSEYITFQFFDTLQAACSYLRNILTTSALLRGAGVGRDGASPIAAALAWILRDGLGMLGSLFFSCLVGSNFDHNVKEWRLFADLINDVGLTLDMLAPLASGSAGYTIVASLGVACKTVCGMVAGATRASITAHFSLRENLADVSAKEGAQETAVTLLGLLLGSALAHRIGESQFVAWFAFVLLTAVHVWSNWLGVGCLTLTSINGQRATILCRAWVEACATGRNGKVDALTPLQVAEIEKPWGPLFLWLRGPRIGYGLKAVAGGTISLQRLFDIFDDCEYLLVLDNRNIPVVSLKSGATDETLLQVYLHCAELERLGSKSTLEDNLAKQLLSSKSYTQREWKYFATALRRAGWDAASTRLDACKGIRVELVESDLNLSDEDDSDK